MDEIVRAFLDEYGLSRENVDRLQGMEREEVERLHDRGCLVNRGRLRASARAGCRGGRRHYLTKTRVTHKKTWVTRHVVK